MKDKSHFSLCRHPVFSASLALLSLSLSNLCAANEINAEWDWALSYESAKLRESTFVRASSEQRHRLNGLLDLQLGYAFSSGHLTSAVAIYAQDLYLESESEAMWWKDRDTQWIVRELAWQGEWQVGEQSLDVSVGKLQVDWGVGYGYRPLDLFKPYRQNPIKLVAEEGAGVFMLSHYDQQGEWSVIASDSSWTQMTQSALDKATAQQGAGLRRFQLVDDTEWQWLAYYDNVRKGALGGSARTVYSDALSLHGSLLWQHQSVTYQIPDEMLKPVDVGEDGEAWQFLMGVNWSTQSGHSVLLEYWYDSRAWSDDEWQMAMERSRQLKQQPLTSPLAASYAQGLQHANLVQHNIMFHWRWDSNAWMAWHGVNNAQWLADITPTLDVLFSPQDGGVIATQWINYQWLDTGLYSVELEFAARFLVGDSQSTYAQIEDKHMMVFNLKGRF
ncbi:hypothetical protein LZU85_00370 [Vibrio sp. IRLE0018]|uniref:hypothetical protein n=1 Tax=Vibrio TaxID=662 RepID=UPI00159429EF|nr:MULTISPECIES: hypothetical protein [Vibrio]MCF8777237.1 hypothetical protein [Vibrio floridensis]NVC62585.1 hypothetical protein [Vibrio sp. 05-20-BW147]HAS6346405.1 hypothetical protein [Vibrio vulnificus]